MDWTKKTPLIVGMESARADFPTDGLQAVLGESRDWTRDELRGLCRRLFPGVNGPPSRGYDTGPRLKDKAGYFVLRYKPGAPNADATIREWKELGPRGWRTARVAYD